LAISTCCWWLDLLLVVGVHLHQHGQVALMAPGGDLVDEGQRLRGHERGQPGGLDRVADRIQPDPGDTCDGQPVQHPQQVLLGQLLPDVDVDLLRGEGGPDQALAAVRECVRGERQPRTRPVQPHQILLGGPLREGAGEGQEHPVEGRVGTVGQPVHELRGRRRHVVDDHVHHHRVVRGDRRDVVPAAQPGIDLGVVRRVEPGVGTVERAEEGQHVHAADQPGQRAVEDLAQTGEVAAEPVGIRDEVDPVRHLGSCVWHR
jgi:hypothetical protein